MILIKEIYKGLGVNTSVESMEIKAFDIYAEQQIKELKGTIENAVSLSNAGYPLGAIQGLKQELKKWHAEKHYQD